MANSKKFYIMGIEAKTVEGPYTFKEAFKKQGQYWWKTAILEMVVDKDGKEVK